MFVLPEFLMRSAHTILIASFAAVALGFGTMAMAQDEDLTDNEVCMECHADTDRSAAVDTGKPRVHNEDGSFIVEDHDMWSCVDCHTYIVEVPHADDVAGKEVDCLECHEEVPEG